MSSEGGEEKKKSRFHVYWLQDSFNEELTTVGRIFYGMMGPPGNFGAAFILIGIFIGLPYFIFIGLRQVASDLAHHHHRVLLYILIGVAVFTVAVIAYRIRSNFRFLYGLLEVLFGILVSLLGAEAVLTEPSLETLSLNVILAIFAGVYVCIRGLNNIEDGLLDKRPMLHSAKFQNLWWSIFHRPLLFKKERVQPPDRVMMAFSLLLTFITAVVLLAMLSRP
jgi:hypothetical protein